MLLKRSGSFLLSGALLLVAVGLLPTSGLAQSGGALISDVVPGGPAATWGIEAGDRILKLGEVELASANDIDRALEGKAPGDKLDVVVLREGRELTLRMVLGAAADDSTRPLLGVMLGGTAGRPVPQRPVSAEERGRILREIAAQLREGYVFADKGETFANQIEADLEKGRFDSFDRLDQFAAELTPYLFGLSNDRHLRVRGASEPGHEGGPQPRRMVRRAPDGDSGAPESGGAHGPVVRRRAPEGGGHGAETGAQRRTVSTPTPDGGRGGNFGFARAEMLEGNIGYIELMGFSGDEASKTAADAAMMSIEGADAVILDLRQNGGGAPFMVRYLSGFFFPEPTHLASTMMRGMEEPAERWTLHDGMPTRAFTDTPLYVLTSRRTFSAAESFTFGLKVNDRITQVGERTGGGGHFGEMVAVSDDLAMFLPRGRTYDPATGLGWEAEGIKPEIEVPAGEALEAAIEAIRG